MGAPILTAKPPEFELRPIVWSEKQEATEKIRYDHMVAETGLGQATIEWKGWKDTSSPRTVYLDGDYIGCADDIELAKALVADHLISIVKMLIK